MKYVIIVLSVLLILLAASCAVNKQPEWLGMQQADPYYYRSIITVQKSIPSYREYARDLALREISTQINVMVRSELATRERENAGYVFTNLEGTIQSYSNAFLEEVELVGTYEAGKTYSAYYRLSKAYYRQQREIRKQNAINQAMQYLLLYDNSTTDLTAYLPMLIQAIELLEPFADLDLRAEYRGQRVNLYTEAMQRLQKLPLLIIPDFETNSTTITALQPTNRTIIGNMLYNKADDLMHRLYNLPVSIRFTQGDGDISFTPASDINGKVELLIGKIKSIEPRQTIVMSADKAYLLSLPKSQSLKDFISGLQFREARLDLIVERPKLFLEVYTDENIDNDSRGRIIAKLAEFNLDVSDTLADAQFILKINISTRQASYIQAINTYSGTADIQMDLLNAHSGGLINSFNFPNQKGTGSTERVARQRAIVTAIRMLCDEYLYRSLVRTVFQP